jgi:cupin 2 domain-containing protein
MARDEGNLFAALPRRRRDELVTVLRASGEVRIERIVSTGQATPPGTWLEQDWREWVVLLAGSASLRFADEDAPRRLAPGDFLDIPAHRLHRVEATDPAAPTVWLAIHYR